MQQELTLGLEPSELCLNMSSSSHFLEITVIVNADIAHEAEVLVEGQISCSTVGIFSPLLAIQLGVRLHSQLSPRFDKLLKM